MPPELILDPSSLDLSNILLDREALRKYNPQRHEMEQLDAIVYIDPERNIVVGYKDVRPDEFWVRGHMPDFPLLPGVLMCEAAAQMVGFYVAYVGYKLGDFIAFGGMENVRFRSAVRPGDRFVLVGRANKLHRRQSLFNVQGFVGKSMVFQGDILGVQFYLRSGQPSESTGG